MPEPCAAVVARATSGAGGDATQTDGSGGGAVPGTLGPFEDHPAGLRAGRPVSRFVVFALFIDLEFFCFFLFYLFYLFFLFFLFYLFYLPYV